MKRSLIIIILVLIAIGLAVLWAAFYLQSNTPAPPAQQNTTPSATSTGAQPAPRTKAAVQAAFMSDIIQYTNETIQLQQTALIGDYALQNWSGHTTGGQGLLKYNSAQGRWVVITDGGGEWTVDGLVEAGVPRDTAAALLAGVQ